jgi:hypothetical protein
MRRARLEAKFRRACHVSAPRLVASAMRSAHYLSPSLRGTSPGRRGLSLALTLIAHLLLLLLLLRLAPHDSSRPAPDRGLATFDVAPEARKAATRPRSTAKQQRASSAPPRPPRTPPPVIAPPMPPLIAGLENFDLRQVPTAVANAGQASAADGQDSASAYGPGEGPGGARLYNAEWYREPTDAELAYYLPERPRSGWGMIACQTVERYRVDNCRSLGDDPPGSGLSRAIRQAAWQFLVRPPRINGKPMIGSWVRIRIEFTENGGIETSRRQ